MPLSGRRSSLREMSSTCRDTGGISSNNPLRRGLFGLLLFFFLCVCFLCVLGLFFLLIVLRVFFVYCFAVICVVFSELLGL